MPLAQALGMRGKQISPCQYAVDPVFVRRVDHDQATDLFGDHVIDRLAQCMGAGDDDGWTAHKAAERRIVRDDGI